MSTRRPPSPQLRRDAGKRQVPGAELAVVGVGGGVVAHSLLLSRPR